MALKLTTEEWVVKARAVHGERYDYSTAVYVDSRTKLQIICPEHGNFMQLAGDHLMASGCRACGLTLNKRGRITTQEEWVEKARAVHGDKYDYSQTVYSGSQCSVTIVCPQHGAFTQRATSHLAGYNCRECGRLDRVEASTGRKCPRRTVGEFIAAAKALYGDKYNYSQVDDLSLQNRWLPMKEKVAIICPAHGEFTQTADAHLGGRGCQQCGVVQRGLVKKHSLEEFILIARATHGKKYDYSQVDYQGRGVKIKIICPEHGPFTQTPDAHKHRTGCPTCGIKKQADAKRFDTQDFIAQGRAVHGEKYSYTLTDYLSAKQKVVIVCPVHGPFAQTPDAHTQGYGCPTCSGWGRWGGALGAKNRQATLYFLKLENEGESFYKIGITFFTVERRYKSLRNLNGYQYTVLAQYSSTNAQAVFEWEQSILSTFANLRYTPTQHFDGITECFSEAEPILAAMPFGTKFF